MRGPQADFAVREGRSLMSTSVPRIDTKVMLPQMCIGEPRSGKNERLHREDTIY
jgi:hypothetical protein